MDYWGMDGFVSQLYGRKEFILLDPEQTPFVYPFPDNHLASQLPDIDNVDLERFPLFAKAQPIRLVLEPGETLYNPNVVLAHGNDARSVNHRDHRQLEFIQLA